MYILDLTSNCSSSGIANILQILKNILNLIQIIAPILLGISLVIIFTKLIINPEEKKNLKSLKNAAFALLFLFAVPTIVNVSMYLLDDTFSVSKCWNSLGKYSTDSKYIDIYDKKNKNKINQSSKFEDGDEREESNDSSNNSSSSTSTGATGQGNFVKYNLTDNQLTQITALCIHEQGTAKGAAAEASLMANRFELYGKKYGTGADGLVNYVKNSGWFAHAASNMADTKVVTSKAKSAVKSVLVDGKRTLPGYIDEHDCFSDISSLSTGGSVSNRSNYKQHKTKVHNKYGSTYIFYSFPDSGSDPFGYTSESNRKNIGDDCYSYSG